MGEAQKKWTLYTVGYEINRATLGGHQQGKTWVCVKPLCALIGGFRFNSVLVLGLLIRSCQLRQLGVVHASGGTLRGTPMCLGLYLALSGKSQGGSGAEREWLPVSEAAWHAGPQHTAVLFFPPRMPIICMGKAMWS